MLQVSKLRKRFLDWSVNLENDISYSADRPDRRLKINTSANIINAVLLRTLKNFKFELWKILITQGCLVPCLVEIGLLREKKKRRRRKCEKITDIETNGRRMTRDQKSSPEHSAQVSYNQWQNLCGNCFDIHEANAFYHGNII